MIVRQTIWKFVHKEFVPLYKNLILLLVGVYTCLANHVIMLCVEIFTQEQYWRIPADMTPAQLDEATQALQPGDCHDNKNIDRSEDNEEPIVREDNDTVHTIVEEPQVEDGTPLDKADSNDDDGAQSDSSEQSGLCIDYHSDSATEGTLSHTIVMH